MIENNNLPPDPFAGGVPDMTAWGAHCRSMYLGLLAAGFSEDQCLEFTIRVMTAMMIAKMLWWCIMRTKVRPDIRLSAVVVRACECGHKREIGKPCEGCGSKKPAKVKDLGVIASSRRRWWDRFKWNAWQYFLAQRRIRKTNREMLRSCGK